MDQSAGLAGCPEPYILPSRTGLLLNKSEGMPCPPPPRQAGGRWRASGGARARMHGWASGRLRARGGCTRARGGWARGGWGRARAGGQAAASGRAGCRRAGSVSICNLAPLTPDAGGPERETRFPCARKSLKLANLSSDAGRHSCERARPAEAHLDAAEALATGGKGQHTIANRSSDAWQALRASPAGRGTTGCQGNICVRFDQAMHASSLDRPSTTGCHRGRGRRGGGETYGTLAIRSRDARELAR